MSPFKGVYDTNHFLSIADLIHLIVEDQLVMMLKDGRGQSPTMVLTRKMKQLRLHPSS